MWRVAKNGLFDLRGLWSTLPARDSVQSSAEHDKGRKLTSLSKEACPEDSTPET